MIDRRTFIAGGIACGAVQPLLARALTGLASAAEAMRPADFLGTLLYARGGRTRFTRNYGSADLERRVPITGATRFAFGSASKWLTAVAVLKLVEGRRLHLDRPITTYLPRFRPDTGGRVTLSHLLSNTSGLPDLLVRAIATDPALRTAQDGAAAMVARFAGGDLSFEPGADFDYNVLNWVIVNAIVEGAAGKPFSEAMRDLVFRPLGLRTLALANEGWAAIPDMANAYGSIQPPQIKMTPVPAFAAASGNVVGTALDAMRAAHGVFATRFLDATSRAALRRVRWPAEDYALGGRVHAIGGRRWAWLTGKVGGYRAHIAQNLARDETIVLFNNTDLPQPALSAWVESIAVASARYA